MKGTTMSAPLKAILVLAVAMYLAHILSAGAQHIVSLDF